MAPVGRLPALRVTWSAPVACVNAVAPVVSVSTLRVSVKLVQSPTTTISAAPSASKPTRRHGTGSSHCGAARASLSKTSTTTVPASTGLWLRVWVMMIPAPSIVASSPLTSCEE